MKKIFIFFALIISACESENYDIISSDNFITVERGNAPFLKFSKLSGVSIIYDKSIPFKDLNKNKKLDKYEDWRLSSEERAIDLASKLSLNEIAGLMLYSSHQSLPGRSMGAWMSSSYNGLPFEQSNALASDLTDEQRKFITEDNLRHILITSVDSPEVAAIWSNNVQELSESLGFGIPVNVSSDPRHGNDAFALFNSGEKQKISIWPSTLGLAASFDPSLMKKFGEIASIEYRALGITTALSPQIDIATDPRWYRFDGTMGEDVLLSTDLARAYVDGFQSTNNYGWGKESVNAMIKHWPGGGSGEGGRDGHFGYGAYAIYPGNNFENHLKPFTEGAFKLNGQTKKASAVMPYYTVSLGYGDRVGSGFNKYLITDILRNKFNYDGVLCTDWAITKDVSSVSLMQGKSWGVENFSEAERHFLAIDAGMDQFGGNDDYVPVVEAYKIGVEKYGEEYMRKRFEKSAVRLLINIFNVGLFENPYLDIDQSKQTVGNDSFVKEGFNAQLKSIIMLKNSDVLPFSNQKKVYVPKRYNPPTKIFFGMMQTEGRYEYPIDIETISKYFQIVDNPEDADFALLGIKDPDGGNGYDTDDLNNGGNGYMPINLQYSDYTATNAREKSLSGGSPFENFNNRSYKGKTIKTNNYTDMTLVRDTKKIMGEKPVILVLEVSRPMVMKEIESYTDVLLISTGVEDKALLEIISGKVEPSGLLPFQMPANMETVESQFEDMSRDMIPHVDKNGNKYDFAFGMNWNGVIKDHRVKKYK